MRLPKTPCTINAWVTRIDPNRRTTPRGRHKAEKHLAEGQNQCHTCIHTQYWTETGAITTRKTADYATCALDAHITVDERHTDPQRKARRALLRQKQIDSTPWKARKIPSNFLSLLTQLGPGHVYLLTDMATITFTIDGHGLIDADTRHQNALRQQVLQALRATPPITIFILTYLPETTKILTDDTPPRTLHAAIQEIRGFTITSALGTTSKVQWHQLSSPTTRKLYGDYTPLLPSSPEQRFPQGLPETITL